MRVKSLFLSCATLMLMLTLTACQEDWRDIEYYYPEAPEREEPEEPEEPENPDEPEKPDTPPTEVKPRYVWIDAAANFEDYANDREAIARDLQKIYDTGFTDVIVDVRPTDGDVLFQSSVADPLTRVDAWTSGGYRWVERTESFDYLQAFIDEGHKVGLKVNASINTLVGGSLCPYGLGSNGMLYRDDSKRDWVSVINAEEGLINTMDLTDDSTDYGPRFLNPAHDEVVEFICQLLTELAAYDVDGIVLDRCRYDDYGMMSDFSDTSRQKFEEYIGQTVENWPSDVLAPGATDVPSVMTPHFVQWMEFRAKMIHDLVEAAAEAVHAVNPEIRFGCYVGAWYSSYYTSGVNWASPNYDSRNAYRWATEAYSEYGYADHTDFMFLGAYAGTSSIYGSGEWSIQGFTERGAAILMDEVPFAAGPDIGNGTGWTDGGMGHLFPDVIDAVMPTADGLFIFDLCHIKMYDYWEDFQSAFDDYLGR